MEHRSKMNPRKIETILPLRRKRIIDVFAAFTFPPLASPRIKRIKLRITCEQLEFSGTNIVPYSTTKHVVKYFLANFSDKQVSQKIQTRFMQAFYLETYYLLKFYVLHIFYCTFCVSRNLKRTSLCLFYKEPIINYCI